MKIESDVLDSMHTELIEQTHELAGLTQATLTDATLRKMRIRHRSIGFYLDDIGAEIAA